MAHPAERPPWWAAVGTVVFTCLFPGTVVGLVPFLISRWTLRPPFLGSAETRWLGVGLALPAAALMLDFLTRFVREGHGTPAPVAPPSRLVVRGAFRYVRNPGYVAVTSMIVAQGLFFGDPRVLWYAAGVALLFHIFVIVYEEPTLRATFGEEYEAYRRQVPRWLPRLRAAPSDGGGSARS